LSFHIPPALRHRNFRLLWFGLLISVAGSQMQLWALFWHIRTLSDQPIAVSGIGVVRFLPILIFSLIGGVIADSFNRKNVMFATQTTMAVIALLLGLLTLSGAIRLWHIYLLTAIQAVAIAFDLPARQSLVPNLVPVQDLPSAFSVQSMAFEIGAIAGPALSGVVIATLGQHYTYFFNAVSFAAVLAALLLMSPIQAAARPAAAAPTARSVRAGGNLSMIREGIRFIRHQPVILGSMILDFFATFFSSANTLLPYIARDVLHVGPIQYGWLSAAQAIGAVSASLIISQLNQLRRQGLLLLLAVASFGLATILFGVSRHFPLTMLALMWVGASDAVSTVIRNTVRQMQTPDFMRGRMVSINQIFFMGGPQLGEIEAGVVAQAFGTPIAIITGGMGCIVAAGAIALGWPQLRRYNGDEASLAGAPAD